MIEDCHAYEETYTHFQHFLFFYEQLSLFFLEFFIFVSLHQS